MDNKFFEQQALDEATKSPCKKRKVGAIIVDALGTIVGRGFNHGNGKPCEDAEGATESYVEHAEIAAIKDFRNLLNEHMHIAKPLTMYVTQPPCADCRSAIALEGISNIKVVEAFIKFDGDKPRFDLVPSEWALGDAEILTFGARKYKPNNWRHCEDIGRYIAALERHLNAFKAYIEGKPEGELYDTDSGKHHLKHLRCNAGFLLTFTETEDKARGYIQYREDMS